MTIRLFSSRESRDEIRKIAAEQVTFPSLKLDKNVQQNPQFEYRLTKFRAPTLTLEVASSVMQL